MPNDLLKHRLIKIFTFSIMPFSWIIVIWTRVGSELAECCGILITLGVHIFWQWSWLIPLVIWDIWGARKKTSNKTFILVSQQSFLIFCEHCKSKRMFLLPHICWKTIFCTCYYLWVFQFIFCLPWWPVWSFQIGNFNDWKRSSKTETNLFTQYPSGKSES